MRVVAVVPIKTNNVRTPGKNTKLLTNGTPLMHLIQQSLLQSNLINEIYVYCSDESISEYLLPNVKYQKRDVEFDTPDADVIEMMRVFTKKVDADIYVQAHATAPFLSSKTIDKALNLLIEGEYDSAVSVLKLQDFFWQDGKPFNYDPERILRTQDMKPFFVETTGLYVYRKEVIQELRRKIGVNPYLLEIPKIEALDIDDPDDFIIADAVYTYLQNKTP